MNEGIDLNVAMDLSLVRSIINGTDHVSPNYKKK